jgi:hypothetical protein
MYVYVYVWMHVRKTVVLVMRACYGARMYVCICIYMHACT